MRALITGVEGFVGGYFAEYLLSQDVEVFGTVLNEQSLDEVKVTAYVTDITNSTEVEAVISKVEPDVIFHLAAQSSAYHSWKQPQFTMDVNVNGTLNILEAVRAKDKNIRVVLIGSAEEYGYIKPEDVPINEETTLVPGNPYAVSKVAQSMLGKVYSRAYDMDVIMIRAFNHTGPGQTPTFVIPDFAKRIAEIEQGIVEPVIRVGNLAAYRDFTDVRDVVRAYFLLINKGKSGEVYNIGSGKAFKIEELLEKLISFSSVAISIETDPDKVRPSDVPIIQCDSEKFAKTTGWYPEYSIEQTLMDTLNYWRKA